MIRTAVFLFLSILSLLGFPRLMDPTGGYIAVFLLFFVIIFIPGDYLRRLVFSGEEYPLYRFEKAAISSVLGLAFFSFLALFGYGLEVEWIWFYRILCGLALFFSALGLRLSQEEESFFSESINPIPLWVMVGVVVIASFFIGEGARLLDQYYHWNSIQKMLLFPKITLQSNVPHLGGERPFAYSYNSWNLLVALVSRFSGMRFWAVWSLSGFILIPLQIFALFALARILFSDGRVALFCSTFYLLIKTFANTYATERLVGIIGWCDTSNPREIAGIVFWLAILFLFLYFKAHKKRYLFVSALLGTLNLLVHEFHFGYFVAGLVFFLLMHLLLNRGDRLVVRGILLSLGLAVLGGIPILILKYLSILPGVGGAARLPTPLEYPHVIPLGNQWVIPNILACYAPFALPAFLCVPFLLHRYKKTPVGSFLLGTLVLTPLLQVNPLYLEIFKHLLHDPGPFVTFGRRITFLLPNSLVLGAAGYAFLESWNWKTRRNQIFTGIGVLVLVFLLIAQYVPILEWIPNYLRWPLYTRAFIVLAGGAFLWTVIESIHPFSEKIFARIPKVNPASSSFKPDRFMLILTGILFLTVFPVEVNRYRFSKEFRPLKERLGLSEGFSFLNNDIPERSVVLTDLNTAYFLSSYTKHYVIENIRNDRGLADKVRFLLDPEEPLEEKLPDLDRYQVELIYLKDCPKMTKSLYNHPNKFALLYSGTNTVIFRYLK